jgi:lysozyme
METRHQARRVLLLTAGVISLSCGAFASGCFDHGRGGESGSENLNSADAAPDVYRQCPATKTDAGWVVTEGFDVSDYDYAELQIVTQEAPQYKYAFARATAGLGRLDTMFPYYWPQMRRAGLIRGAYQYFNVNRNAAQQADLFVQVLNESGGMVPEDLPPVLDLESTGIMPPEVIQCRAKLWLARVERSTGRIPMIYTAQYMDQAVGTDFGHYPLWVANYVSNPAVTCPRMMTGWAKWDIWQYSEGATVPGIFSNGSRNSDAGGSIALEDAGDGGVGVPVVATADLNYYNGTLDDLVAFVKTTMSTNPPADPPPPANPPVVSPPPGPDAGPDGGPPPPPNPVDCSDGCCIAGP